MKTGWQTKNLGDLCRIRTGKKDVNQGNPDGKFPFFTCAAEHTFSDNYSFDTEALLIAGNGDVGKVSYYNGKFEAYQRTYVLSDFAEVSPRFLYLILDGKLRDTVSKQKLGNTMPYIKVGMLTDFQLPVPPLAEQQRVVGLLDEAFAGLATAKANAKKNLQNARALFESHLQSVYTQRGPGWQTKKLGDVSDVMNGGTPKTGVPEYWAGQHRWITPAEMGKRVSPYVSDTERKITDLGLRDSSARMLPPNSVILSSRAPIGHLVINTEPMGTNQGCKGLIPHSQIETKFLYYYLSSIVDLLNSLGTGATFKELSGGKLKEVTVPVPSLAEQQKIGAKLDRLAEETQRLARLYERKQAALEALKKSLLHQAFTGEL